MQLFESKLVFQLRTFQIGFSGPKTFRGFRETGPQDQRNKAQIIKVRLIILPLHLYFFLSSSCGGHQKMSMKMTTAIISEKIGSLWQLPPKTRKFFHFESSSCPYLCKTHQHFRFFYSWIWSNERVGWAGEIHALDRSFCRSMDCKASKHPEIIIADLPRETG